VRRPAHNLFNLFNKLKQFSIFECALRVKKFCAAAPPETGLPIE
jgi:hypothetical protein